MLVKCVLLICQGSGPRRLPTERWKRLSQAQQKAIYADYQDLGQSPGVTPRPALGLPGAARTVQVRHGKPGVRNGAYLGEGAGG
jgi:hypothetical protein